MSDGMKKRPKLNQKMTLREAMDMLRLSGRLRVFISPTDISAALQDLAKEKRQLHGRN